MSAKKAVLVVSFGTSHKETREKTIGAIERQISESFPDREVRRAFTSGMIMDILEKRDGIHVDDVSEAMDRLAADGYAHVILQPTHIINGDEYDKVVCRAEEHRGSFESVTIGNPLLTESRDFEAVCRAVTAQMPDMKKNEALVLMGHGTGHFADAAYAALDYRFKALGYDNVFVGTVEGYPSLGEVMKQVKKYMPQKVILMPLMVVAGDHAVNDMAGEDEESWRSVFEREGFETECILKGLGEFTEIREIYIQHLRDADQRTE